MIRCARCATETPRLTLAQTRCPDCQRAVDEVIRKDTERRRPRWDRAKDLTGAVR